MKGETPSPTYNPDNIIDFFAPITTEWQPSFFILKLPEIIETFLPPTYLNNTRIDQFTDNPAIILFYFYSILMVPELGYKGLLS